MRPHAYPAPVSARPDPSPWILREVPTPPKPRLLVQVRQALRTRHYSARTEEAYIGWIRRFIFFHDKKHPAGLGEAEVTRFLSSLATDRHVSASTQNQALSALLFLYGEVLGRNLAWLAGIVRARGPRRLPVVLSRDEVRRGPAAVKSPLDLPTGGGGP